MQVFVVNPGGQRFTIEVHNYDKVLTMKEKIEKSQGIPVAKQTLYLNDTVLQDNLDITESQIHANPIILLTISPDTNPNPNPNPNQNNNNNNHQTVQSPTDPIDEFDQILETVQSLDSLDKFLGSEDLVEQYLGDQVTHYQSIFDEEDLPLTTEHFSTIQNYWPDATAQEVTETEKPPPRVKEIIEIKDSPEKKKIKVSPRKLTVMVKPFMETREIPVEVNAGDKVRELKKELAKMQQRGEIDLPKEGYFFIHRNDVLDENLSFYHNGVAHGDKFEIFRGSYTIGR